MLDSVDFCGLMDTQNRCMLKSARVQETPRHYTYKWNYSVDLDTPLCLFYVCEEDLYIKGHV